MSRRLWSIWGGGCKRRPINRVLLTYLLGMSVICFTRLLQAIGLAKEKSNFKRVQGILKQLLKTKRSMEQNWTEVITVSSLMIYPRQCNANAEWSKIEQKSSRWAAWWYIQGNAMQTQNETFRSHHINKKNVCYTILPLKHVDKQIS